MSLTGVVLAGGRSSRMGAPKALLDYRGAPFVTRILDALEALEVRPRVLVVGADAAPIRAAVASYDCRVIENPDVDGGPIASLRAALRALPPLQPSGLVAWPVDLPHVRLTTLERLIDTHRRTGAPAVVPAFADRRGHPVIWGAATFDALLTNATAAREGARAVLHTLGPLVTTVVVDDPAVVSSINTPAEYQRLVREWNRAY